MLPSLIHRKNPCMISSVRPNDSSEDSADSDDSSEDSMLISEIFSSHFSVDRRGRAVVVLMLGRISRSGSVFLSRMLSVAPVVS